MLSGGYQGHFVDAWPWMGQPRMAHSRICCSLMWKSSLGMWGWWQPMDCETLLLDPAGMRQETSSVQTLGFRRADFWEGSRWPPIGGSWEVQMFRKAVRPSRAASLCSRMAHPCTWRHQFVRRPLGEVGSAWRSSTAERQCRRVERDRDTKEDFLKPCLGL